MIQRSAIGGDEPATDWGEALAQAGAAAVARRNHDQLPRRLTEITRFGLTSVGAAEQAGLDLARLLIDAGLTSTEVVRRALVMLGHRAQGPAVTALQAALAAGHADAVQRLLLQQQEAIHQAVILARNRAEQALRQSEDRFRTLFDQAPVGIGIGDTQGRIHDANAALQRMFGYTLEEFRQIRVEDFVQADDAVPIWQNYAALVAGDLEEFRTEKRYLHKNGQIIWTNLSVSLVRNARGEPAFQVAVMEDITQRHELQQQLRYEATHDSLTGLPNRAMFLQRLDTLIAAGGTDGRIAVAFLDLDGFKFVNDSRGHLVGDQVLIAVSRRLATTAHQHGALLARLAGDEFVVLLIRSGGRLNAVAEDLLAALKEPIEVEGQQPVHVRASAGVVELPVVDADAERVLRLRIWRCTRPRRAARGRWCRTTRTEPYASCPGSRSP